MYCVVCLSFCFNKKNSILRVFESRVLEFDLKRFEVFISVFSTSNCEEVHHFKSSHLIVRNMEFDDERFLTLVFQFPCIYDNHDPNYKNADSREICWADIGNEMHCSGEWNHFTFVVPMHLLFIFVAE